MYQPSNRAWYILQSNTMLFDEPYYLRINEARWLAAKTLIDAVQQTLPQPLRTCLDVGSGPGWFSERLVSEGLKVEAWEGRPELASEAKRRVPEATVRHLDVESYVIEAVQPCFDLVFCFGLLYHVENPLRLIRNLHHLTGTFLLLETMTVPFYEPVFHLTLESQIETQGLTYVALVPSSSAVAAALHSAGFAHVYAFKGEVAHEDFVETPERHPRRRIFAASHVPLDIQDLEPQEALTARKYDYRKSRRPVRA